MGRTDSTPENLKAIAGSTEPVDRLNLLNRWISAKLDELGAADERLAKRLEHLNTTEQSLKTLFEALRKQVAETHPVLKELSQLRATALTAVEQVVRAGKDRSSHALQARPIDAGLEERLANQVVACEEKIAELCRSAEEAFVGRTGQFDAHLDANSRTVANYMEHRLLGAQQNLDALVNRMDDQLRVAEGRATEITRTVDIYAAEAVTRLRNEFDTMVAPIQQRLKTQVSEMETQISNEMSTVEETMKAQLNGFYLHMDQTGVTLQNQLEQLAEDFRKQADRTLAFARQHVRQQIDLIEDETRLAVRPIIQSIDERRAGAERQSEALLAGIDDAMKIRLAELRRSGEAVIQLVETQLVDKVKLLRPQAHAAIELAQKQIGQQLSTALENVRNTVELNEKQLADRIEDLRPRAAAALQTAKADISQQIASLESEATTATGWIEQRLNQRIDELTYRARKTVNEQMRDLDDASERLRRRESSERSIETSGKSLDVDIHIENPNSQPRTNAA